MRNRLADETSPYLQQHADNPVNWQPWDEAALAQAREQNRPILLSVGYSACHWCHVMAHESFEDDGTAAVMNDHFINIKVDREERPDLDKVYQTAHHLLTQQTGGWPLTVFLDPFTLIPFFSGTYFPKSPRHQLPGFTDLLRRIEDVFRNQRESLDEQGEKILKFMSQLNEVTHESGLLDDQELYEQAYQQLHNEYDSTDGGIGAAPKFPMATTFSWLLQLWAYRERIGDKDRQMLDMVMNTLTKMARGGIYDHLGGGFCRYSTDAKWMIPHFEKMTSDNGQLLSLYSDALHIGKDELFAQAISQTAEWLLNDMRDAQGGFYSAIDADSEGEEGKYYVWRKNDLKKLLTEDEYLVIETLYGLDKPANFESKWNLHRHDSWRAVVDRLFLSREDAQAALTSGKQKMLAARQKRIAPGVDDKVLTAWNGLVIEGLAKAGVQLNRPEWIDGAQRAADFLQTNVFVDGKLHATWKQEPRYTGYLDDYACLLNGLLALLSANWQERTADFARTLANSLLDQFFDKDKGGFFFTAHTAESLIYRPKPTMDDALPAGNATAAQGLLKIGHLFGDTKMIDAAVETLLWGRRMAEKYPAGHCGLLVGMASQTYEPTQVILRGPAHSIAEWQSAITTSYQPWLQVYGIPFTDSQGAASKTLPSYLPKLVRLDEQQQVKAYLCSGLQCSLPITELNELKAAIKQS